MNLVVGGPAVCVMTNTLGRDEQYAAIAESILNELDGA